MKEEIKDNSHPIKELIDNNFEYEKGQTYWKSPNHLYKKEIKRRTSRGCDGELIKIRYTENDKNRYISISTDRTDCIAVNDGNGNYRNAIELASAIESAVKN